MSGAPELGFVYTVAGVVLLAAAGLPLGKRWGRSIDAILIVGVVVALGVWTRVAVYGSPAYGTDEVAFDQGAAQLLLQGTNPYGADLSWTLDAFRVLPSGTTNTLLGGFVHSLDYPAGAFLAYVPVLAVGIQAQAALYVDAAFWILGMVAMWLALPPRFRGLVPIIASLELYVNYATGGVTDPLMIPFLVAAFWRWDRFGDPSEPSAARWLGPIALGLACTVKQSAWFVVPFALIAIALEARLHGRGRSVVTRYFFLLAAAFLVPNVPFIIWDPSAWLTSVLLPFFDPLVPFGQGFVAFATTFFVAGGNLVAFTLAGALVMLAALVALVGWYGSLKRILPALPLVALLLPTRSLNSYFVYAVPAILVSLATVDGIGSRAAVSERLRRWAARFMSVAFAAGGAALLVVALLSPGPLVLEPVDQHTTGALQSVDSVVVRAHNASAADLEPHFAVALGPYMSSYWIIHEGPTVLPAGATAEYVLLAPNTASMPGVDQQSVLYALTASPPSISSARLFPAVEERAQILPQAINHEVADPPEVDFTVQLVDRLNTPIQRSGVSISMGQVLYTAEGLYPGETSINGQPEGQSPVEALTDDNGIAHFHVIAIQQQPYEVFYQAWITDPFPHGYSASVSVNFVVDGVGKQ